MTAANGAASAIDTVIAYFGQLISSQGDTLELVRQDHKTLLLRYEAHPDDECDTCVLSDESLAALVLDAVQARGCDIESVEILRASG